MYIQWLCMTIYTITLKQFATFAIILCFYLNFKHWGARMAQWIRSLDLTTHTSLSPNCKIGCTWLKAASDNSWPVAWKGRWFSPGSPFSSTTKTGRHDIAEILLKVALNTKIQIQTLNKYTSKFKINIYVLSIYNLNKKPILSLNYLLYHTQANLYTLTSNCDFIISVCWVMCTFNLLCTFEYREV